MNFQWVGALMIIGGCGVFGFSMAADYIREEYSLRQLISALDYMFCELQYTAASLPQICEKIGMEFRGTVGQVFRNLSIELDAASGPSASGCMDLALKRTGTVTKMTDRHFRELGNVLGKFEMEGQLRAMESVREQCRNALGELIKDKQSRVRNYETLGLCAGAALAIILV